MIILFLDLLLTQQLNMSGDHTSCARGRSVKMFMSHILHKKKFPSFTNQNGNEYENEYENQDPNVYENSNSNPNEYEKQHQNIPLYIYRKYNS
jgi:hypothetical protein